MARNADHSVHLQAIAHNPTLYDEPTAEALPEITTLFNPLGPAPPLTSLVLMEVTRVEPSGASLRVVNLSWDVAPLSRGFAPYGGALIQRRTVLTSTHRGAGDSRDAGAWAAPWKPMRRQLSRPSRRSVAMCWTLTIIRS